MTKMIEPKVGDVWKTKAGEYQLVYQQKCEGWLGVQEQKSGACVSEWFGRNELTRLVERDGERVPEITPELEERFAASCRVMAKGAGCSRVLCWYCPGHKDHNGGVHCNKNGWTTGGISEDNGKAESAKRWLREHGYDVPGEAPKLVRRGIVGWTVNGRPKIIWPGRSGDDAVDFEKINAYVYDDPNDPESEFCMAVPMLLWDRNRHGETMLFDPKEIISGEVIRLLPVAAIVEE